VINPRGYYNSLIQRAPTFEGGLVRSAMYSYLVTKKDDSSYDALSSLISVNRDSIANMSNPYGYYDSSFNVPIPLMEDHYVAQCIHTL
jgi:hypothetical protein